MNDLLAAAAKVVNLAEGYSANADLSAALADLRRLVRRYEFASEAEEVAVALRASFAFDAERQEVTLTVGKDTLVLSTKSAVWKRLTEALTTP